MSEDAEDNNQSSWGWSKKKEDSKALEKLMSGDTEDKNQSSWGKSK